MKTLLTLAVSTVLVTSLFCMEGRTACAQESETITQEEIFEMYGASDEAREMFAEADRILQQEEDAKNQRRERSLVILVLCLITSLAPVVVFLVKHHDQLREAKANAWGIISASLILLAGSAAIFAINYGILTLKAELGADFMRLMAVVIVFAGVIATIVALKK